MAVLSADTGALLHDDASLHAALAMLGNAEPLRMRVELADDAPVGASLPDWMVNPSGASSSSDQGHLPHWMLCPAATATAASEPAVQEVQQPEHAHQADQMRRTGHDWDATAGSFALLPDPAEEWHQHDDAWMPSSPQAQPVWGDADEDEGDGYGGSPGAMGPWWPTSGASWTIDATATSSSSSSSSHGHRADSSPPAPPPMLASGSARWACAGAAPPAPYGCASDNGRGRFFAM